MDDFALFLDSLQLVGAIASLLRASARHAGGHAGPQSAGMGPPHAAPAHRALRWRVGIDLPRAILG